MARGTRAPSQHSYRGALGRTQTATVHVTGPNGELLVASVHTTIDACSDPELADRLVSDQPDRAINVVRVEAGEPIHVGVPVVYHDPSTEILVLVLAEAQRHRELDERIALYERLRTDPSPIPGYVKQFAVVFGGRGLRAYLEERVQQALEQERHGKANAAEFARKEADSARREADFARRDKEMAARERELTRKEQELDRMRAETRARVLAAVQTSAFTPVDLAAEPAPPQREEQSVSMTMPLERHDLEPETLSAELGPALAAISPEAQVDVPVDFEDSTRISDSPVAGPPAVATTAELPVLTSDPWLDFAATGVTSSLRVTEGADPVIRLALIAGDHMARGLGGPLDVRVLLHRTPTYPVVALVIGPPAALTAPDLTQVAVIPLDIATDLDRSALGVLAKKFELLVDIVVRGRAVRRVRITAPLAENVAYILRAADDHLRDVSADGGTVPSFERARDLVLGAGFDLLGVGHAEHSEFRDDKLAPLDTAQHVRRALAIARRFAKPAREDYLVSLRGFPLEHWRELRRRVLERAVEWGLWMGPELAQVAVSEGLARSRRDLVGKLEAGFEVLRRDPAAFDLDADAAEDNLKALAEEAQTLSANTAAPANGASGRPASGAIKSEDVSTVSGSIDGVPEALVPRVRPVDELLTLLDDKRQRVSAAAELCDRGDPRAAVPVIMSVKKMSRAEAVRILGKSVKFGAAAAQPLIEGLGSSKAFLRHGSALALGLLRTDEGTQAVIQQLVEEPTEIWREIARAIGQIGPTALMPLASQTGRLGDRLPQISERIAWAMAHVGVRGGKAALEQMAAGQSLMAPLAKQALSLLENAARDEVRVIPGAPSRDVTVNRAFSRRFFEALEADRPDLAEPALHDLDASRPQELEDADLIVDDEEEAELDESDLIHS